MIPIILACPFCQDPLVETETCEDGDGNVLSFRIVCDECGAEGPLASTEQRAAEVWNIPVRTVQVDKTP